MASVLEAPVRELEVETGARSLTLQEELQILEGEALRLGMSPEELSKICAIGPCPAQIRTRIAMLRRWIFNRPS